MVTVIGPGGSGKTRLALEAARRLGGTLRGWGRVAGVGPARRLRPWWPPRRARALGVAEHRSLSVLDAVAATVGPRHLLLVVDNCEHVIDAAAQLCEQLLTAGEDLRVLATSREALGVSGEVRFALGPLPVPTSQDDGSRDRGQRCGHPFSRPSRPGRRRIRAHPRFAGRGGDDRRAPRRPTPGHRAGRRPARRHQPRRPGRRSGRPLRRAGGSNPGRDREAGVVGGQCRMELPAAQRRRATGVPPLVGVPRPLHRGRGPGGRGPRRRDRGVETGSTFHAGGAPTRPGRSVPIRHARDPASVRPGAPRPRPAATGR